MIVQCRQILSNKNNSDTRLQKLDLVKEGKYVCTNATLPSLQQDATLSCLQQDYCKGLKTFSL